MPNGQRRGGFIKRPPRSESSAESKVASTLKAYFLEVHTHPGDPFKLKADCTKMTREMLHLIQTDQGHKKEILHETLEKCKMTPELADKCDELVHDKASHGDLEGFCEGLVDQVQSHIVANGDSSHLPHDPAHETHIASLLEVDRVTPPPGEAHLDYSRDGPPNASDFVIMHTGGSTSAEESQCQSEGGEYCPGGDEDGFASHSDHLTTTGKTLYKPRPHPSHDPHFGGSTKLAAPGLIVMSLLGLLAFS